MQIILIYRVKANQMKMTKEPAYSLANHTYGLDTAREESLRLLRRTMRKRRGFFTLKDSKEDI